MPEFDLIEKYLKPLAWHEGALKLEDDAALINASDGCSLVLSKDMMVAGVHFDPAIEPKLVAQKLLRVNLSDLAAMGAEPKGYLLGINLPKTMAEGEREKWLASFTSGLAQDQKKYDISLLGGDTVSGEDELVLTITIIGEVPMGTAIKRGGANTGDIICLTGSLGDAALGLQCQLGLLNPSEKSNNELLNRLYLPSPRVPLGVALRGIATAAIDVSDGLLADLGHVLKASGKGAEVRLDKLPLSKAAIECFEAEAKPLENFWPFIYGGGDDYELLFTCSAANLDKIKKLSKKIALDITEIGVINDASGISMVDKYGKSLDIKKYGYDHFS